MNNQLNNNSSICQFYVVFGKGETQFPQDNNVYINADQFKQVEELRNAIVNAYNNALLKYQDRERLSNRIIFGIPSENYRKRAEQIMSEVGVTNGVVEVFPKYDEIQTKTATPKIIETVKNAPISASDGAIQSTNNSKGTDARQPLDMNKEVSIPQQGPTNIDNISSNQDPSFEEEKNAVPYSYQPGNVYRGELSRGESLSTQSTFSNEDSSMRYGNARNNLRGMTKARKKKRPNAFVSLPIIIFILSALLLISSAVLLFLID